MKLRTTGSVKLHDDNQRIPDMTSSVRAFIESLPTSEKNDYLREVAFSKFVSSDTAPPAVRRSRAINKWLAAERNNESTNERLLTVHPQYQILPRVGFEVFIAKVAAIIEQIVGCVPPVEGLLGSFSGGATTSKRRTESHPASKYLGKADITARAMEFFDSVLDESPLWLSLRGSSEIRTVPGNVLFTVLKSTDIDRCACKEPDLNMYMQKGVGDVIRKGLRRNGINLNDQSINQRLARKGSADGSLATLDLSSASDSVCSQLVFLCMPITWYTLLDSLRSPVTMIDGEPHVNEMFSSMGNGFTFELESLLFFSIARATAYFRGVSGTISIYGDDIIVPVELALDLIHVLSFLGFETNQSKSFWEGDFRESCGGHFVTGRCVTPFYVKRPIDRLISAMHAANQLRKWCEQEGFSVLDPVGFELWSSLASLVPLSLWGGHDTSDKTRLVSYWQPDNPARLMEITTDKMNPSEGAYLLWHDSVESRRTIQTHVSTSIRKKESGRYRRVKIYDDRKPEFAWLAELGICSE